MFKQIHYREEVFLFPGYKHKNIQLKKGNGQSMKKYLRSISAAVLIVVTVLSLACCGTADSLNTYYRKFTETQNCTLSVKFSLSANGQSVVTESVATIDGQKAKFEVTASVLGQSQSVTTYMEQIGNDTYLYQNTGFSWVKSKMTDESSDSALDTAKELQELFNEEYYTYDKENKRYVMNSDASVDIANVGKFTDSVIQKLNDQYKLTATVETQGISGTFEMVLKDIGEASVTLPDATENEE